MSNFYIEVSKDDLRYVNKKFAKAPKKINRVLRNAINQTASVALRKIKKGRGKGYTIKATGFNKDIKTQRANASHLDATIIAKGRPRTLQQFKTSNRGTRGISADVTKSGLKALINSAGAAAFEGKGGNINGLIAQRVGKERTPIKVLHSNSVPVMVRKIYEGERGGQGDMQGLIQSTLHDKIREQVEKVI